MSDMYLINMNSMLITGTSRENFFFQLKKKKNSVMCK